MRETRLSVEHLSTTGEQLPLVFFQSYALVKSAMAWANAKEGRISKEEMIRIADACADLQMDAEARRWFVVDWISSTTHHNMNTNEAICALDRTRHPAEAALDPRETVNASQSSNDTFVTAAAVATLRCAKDHLVPGAARLANAFRHSSSEHNLRSVLKVARTHLQDASVMTLGQEWEAHAEALDEAVGVVEAACSVLEGVSLGGTVIGHGINAPIGVGEAAVERLSALSGLSLHLVANRIAYQSNMTGFVTFHASVATLACLVRKIAQDLRHQLSQDVREWSATPTQEGSSIVPAKPNPCGAEALCMAAIDVIGSDTSVRMAAASGEFQLNVMRTLIVRHCLRSSTIMACSMDAFAEQVVLAGRPVGRRGSSTRVSRSFGLATALTPDMGFSETSKLVNSLRAEGKDARALATAVGAAVWARAIDRMSRAVAYPSTTR